MYFVQKDILPHMEDLKREAHLALVEEYKGFYHLNTWFIYGRIIEDHHKYPTFNNGILKNKNQMCRMIKNYLLSIGATEDAGKKRSGKRLRLPEGFWVE